MQHVLYLDNAATSFPKPPGVLKAMEECLARHGGNPGRSGHRLSLEAGRIVFRAREKVAQLLGVSDSARVIFTSNATMAINITLFGFLREGDHVVTTSMEHNAVMRPLRHLEKIRHLKLTIVQCTPEGRLEARHVKEALTGETRLIVMTGASNVTGTLFPVAEVAALKGKVPLLVDAAQTAGAVPLAPERDGIDMAAFSGHKSLMGPMGTGVLYMRQGMELEPLFFGGTGSLSESEEMPEFLPDRFECGTLNVVGLAGLEAAAGHILEHGVEAVGAHERSLMAHLIEGLSSLGGVTIHGTASPRESVAIVSLTMEGHDPAALAHALDRQFSIMVRPGLHCAPLAHRTIGTFPAGTLRVSPGFSTSHEDIGAFLSALGAIKDSRHG
ncbi:MAG: aminotransferase class V-fold PLP-dependent enzyme [Candidatus Eremiobacteraeota bacterium]|nr:aminotransferase class V-fold PLP-dependent enzyme [Candidatus Eremiobacteraeota bacterium]